MKIEIPKLDRNRLDCVRFVVRAASKESSRYAIQHILVEKGRFVATDGRRLHIAEFEHDYEPGLYEVMSCKINGVILLLATDPGNFPKYRDIIPKHKNFFEANGVSEPWSLAANITFGLAKKGIMINPHFLSEAATGDSVKVYYGESDLPVILVYDSGKKAVLMPVTPPTIEYKKDK